VYISISSASPASPAPDKCSVYKHFSGSGEVCIITFPAPERCRGPTATPMTLGILREGHFMVYLDLQKGYEHRRKLVINMGVAKNLGKVYFQTRF